MFENIKSEAELSATPEEETPAESAPAKENPSEEPKPVSEDAKPPKTEDEKPEKKDPKDVDTDLHKKDNPYNSRFKEVRSQRNEARQQVKDFQKQVSNLQKEVDNLKDSLKEDAPKFETVEDMQDFLSKFPDKVVKQVMDKLESKQNAVKDKEKETKSILDEQLEQIEDEFEVTLDSKQQEKLFKFALENKFKELPAAYKLMMKLEGKSKEVEKEEKKEKIELRKKDSKVSTSKSSSKETSHIHIPGQSMDDLVSDIQSNLS